MNLLLTEQERDRFAAWLEMEVTTGRGLIERMKLLGPHAALAIEREKAEVAAALVIARKLRATHAG